MIPNIQVSIIIGILLLTTASAYYNNNKLFYTNAGCNTVGVRFDINLGFNDVQCTGALRDAVDDGYVCMGATNNIVRLNTDFDLKYTDQASCEAVVDCGPLQCENNVSCDEQCQWVDISSYLTGMGYWGAARPNALCAFCDASPSGGFLDAKGADDPNTNLYTFTPHLDGCTNSFAGNYNAAATHDDGSCVAVSASTHNCDDLKTAYNGKCSC